MYIVAAQRSPVGRHRGALSSVRPDDLAAAVILPLLQQQPAIREHVEHVILGAANQAGEDNRNVARMVALLVGLPFSVAAHTVNRLCASGLEAIADGMRRIQTGDADLVIAGGVEAMSRAPFVMARAEEALPRAAPAIFDTSLGWRFPNPKLAMRIPLESMGETAENVAAKWKITREEQDAFACSSHTKALSAIKTGAFAEEIVPVGVPAVVSAKKIETQFVTVDEGPRAATSPEALAKLKPVFREGGTVTAGNSSSLNDGASAVLLASKAALRRYKLTPRAQIVSVATVGVDPSFMGEGPIFSTPKALARAGWSKRDLDLVELNEAFAAQALACIRGLELNPDICNVHGGAIALGHPLGSTGARLVVTLLHALERHNKRRGLASLCVGVGQGMSMCIERVS